MSAIKRSLRSNRPTVVQDDIKSDAPLGHLLPELRPALSVRLVSHKDVGAWRVVEQLLQEVVQV